LATLAMQRRIFCEAELKVVAGKKKMKICGGEGV
jgi:hypothetical protein